MVLRIHAKNVGPQGVLVKLYEINTWNYYTTKQGLLDVNLELSGVGATVEEVFKLPDNNPFVR